MVANGEVVLQHDMLRIRNDKITCTFLWNQGSLIHLGLESFKKDTTKVYFVGNTLH